MRCVIHPCQSMREKIGDEPIAVHHLHEAERRVRNYRSQGFRPRLTLQPKLSRAS